MTDTEKMMQYDEDVKKIAQIIKYRFYSEETSEEEWGDEDQKEWRQDRLMEKAERVYTILDGDVDCAKKVLWFLQINPVLGKRFVESL